MFSNMLKQLKNIHKYSVSDLMVLLKENGIICTYTIKSDYEGIRKYFNKCITYMYNNVAIHDTKKSGGYIDYINYHYIKYIYNNFSKKEYLDCFSNMRLSISNGLYLPEDEPKCNLFWILKVIHGLSPKLKKNFVNTLPIQVINYILRKKISGLTLLAKTRKKVIENEEKT